MADTPKKKSAKKKTVSLWVFACRWVKNREDAWFFCDWPLRTSSVRDRKERIADGAECGPIVRVEVPRG